MKSVVIEIRQGIARDEARKARARVDAAAAQHIDAFLQDRRPHDVEQCFRGLAKALHARATAKVDAPLADSLFGFQRSSSVAEDTKTSAWDEADRRLFAGRGG